MFAQADAVTWAQLLQENALVAIAAFCGGGLIWLARRFFAQPGGVFTRLAESVIICNERNSVTLQKLELVYAEQRSLCQKHVDTMATINAAMAVLTAWHADETKPVVMHKIRQALILACDALEPLGAQYKPEMVAELHAIRARLE